MSDESESGVLKATALKSDLATALDGDLLLYRTALELLTATAEENLNLHHNMETTAFDMPQAAGELFKSLFTCILRMSDFERLTLYHQLVEELNSEAFPSGEEHHARQT